jgi:hypothetical protein
MRTERSNAFHPQQARDDGKYLKPFMNIIDYLALVFMGYGIWRGWRKGLGYELPGLLGVAVFAITGFGAIRWTYLGLDSVSQFTPFRVGFLSAPLLFAAAFILVRHRFKQFQVWGEKRFQGTRQRAYGAAAGFFRTAIISGFVIVYFGLWNVGFIHRTFAEHSLIGRTLTTWILPVYQTLFEKQEEKSKEAVPEPTPESESSSEAQGRIPSTSSR